MDQLGNRLIEQGIITAPQLEQALARQRTHGGRLGENLKELGFIHDSDLDHVFRKTPAAPRSIQETGLEYVQVEDLLLKHALFLGEFKLAEICERIKLPFMVVEGVLDNLKKERLVEIKGATSYTSMAYQYQITDAGRSKCLKLLELSRYVGPAPVTLDAYTEMVEFQTVKSIIVTEAEIRSAFSHLVIEDEKLQRLGPAVSSGQALFIYGPPGNGKTAIAEAIGNVLTDAVYVPYAICVADQIINVYDPVSHIRIDESSRAGDAGDQRWLRVKRPVVMTGGELTMRMLDLDFNPIVKFYEAPLQMKANNGLLIIDDFGRQQVEPQSILNRWIVPLDRRIDFLTLNTGIKFTVPFDLLLIFATNLSPAELVDEAFLRRIHYKIKISHPSENEFRSIFRVVCRNAGIPFTEEAYEFLMTHLYRARNLPLSACHPRDLIEHVVNYSRYFSRPPELNETTLRFACDNYFVSGN
jgi:predicted ATPase with chaperone activity